MNWEQLFTWQYLIAGYGARYPTERNQMTLPAAVPKFRHVPDSERYKRVTSSTVLIKRDEGALKRNAEQIVFQTSGEIGRFTLGIEPENLRILKKPLRNKSDYSYTSSKDDNRNHHTQSSQDLTNTNSNMNQATNTTNYNRNDGYDTSRLTQRDSARDNLSTGRSNNSFNSSLTSPSTTSRNPFGNTFNSTSSSHSGNVDRYRQTLQSLDNSFSRREKRDLLAAAGQTQPVHVVPWSAATNQHEFLQSKPWVLKLRNDTSSQGNRASSNNS